VDLVHVPYRGAQPALTDLISGQVQVMFAASTVEYIKTGKVRALAVTIPTRSEGVIVALVKALNAGSIPFDAHKLHHVAPFLGFVGNELAKIGGRARKHRAAQVGKPRPELGIGKASIDLLVELRDDLCRRILGCAEAIPIARLVARHELPHG